MDSLEDRLNKEFNAIEQNKAFSEGMLSDFKQQLVGRLLKDLSTISPRAIVPLQSKCHAVKVSIYANNKPQAERHQWMHVYVHFIPYDLLAEVKLTCDINWLNFFSFNALLSALLIILINYLPRPMSAQQKKWCKTLISLGFTRKKATVLSTKIDQFSDGQLQIYQYLSSHNHNDTEALVAWCLNNVPQQISAVQIRWFCHIFEEHKDREHALSVAMHADNIQFNTAEHLVSIHGVSIKLPKTPYYYFLWYIQKRLDGDGWQINPATNRPDKITALELIHLMQKYGGHGKAINDLETQGLTSKKLDQNRNKIKDELITRLGEELAGNYLFESRRDAKSQRYWYRISFDRTKIEIK